MFERVLLLRNVAFPPASTLMQNEALSTSKPEDTSVLPALPNFYTKRNQEYSILKYGSLPSCRRLLMYVISLTPT